MGLPQTQFPKIIDAEVSADRVISAPIGAISPLWLAFGAAAGMGVTFWWMTRWLRPTHLEAAPMPALAAPEPVAPLAIAAPVVEAAVEITETVVETAHDLVANVEPVLAAPVLDTAPIPAPLVEIKVEPIEPGPVAAKKTTPAAPKPAKAKPAPSLKAAAPKAASAPKLVAAPKAESAVVAIPTARPPRRKPRV